MTTALSIFLKEFERGTQVSHDTQVRDSQFPVIYGIDMTLKLRRWHYVWEL